MKYNKTLELWLHVLVVIYQLRISQHFIPLLKVKDYVTYISKEGNGSVVQNLDELF